MSLDNLSVEDFENAIKKFGSGRKAAAGLGVPQTTFRDAFKRAKLGQFTAKINVNTRYIYASDKPQYLIVSSAQDGTKIDEPFLENLERYAKFLDAEILISGFTYNKSLFTEHDKKKVFFPERIDKYLTNDKVVIGDELVFCGEMNTLPTAVTPLSGFHNYTGTRSGVFPHPKVQLESVPTMKGEPAKVLMTTGAVTLPNYVPKKAGIKAEFHHISGAVIIEIKPDGGFYARHLIADDKGEFYDLDHHVSVNGVAVINECEAITWGDIHTSRLTQDITTGCWGLPFSVEFFGTSTTNEETSNEFVSIFNRLKPKVQLFHDVLDFEVRNHHQIKDHIFIFDQYRKMATVEDEISRVADFLLASCRPGTTSVVVESNHDLAFERWLKTADYRDDPANAQFFLKNVALLYENAGDNNFSILAHNLENLLDPLADIVFLKEDQSYRICEWDKGGIECALHGHNGPNGARGNYKQFTKLGPRANVGHAHSPAIYEGIYQAGVTASLDHGYNVGPSSWSHSHIVTYLNGKRTIVTQDKSGKYTLMD